MFILYGRVREMDGAMMAVMTTSDRDLAHSEAATIGAEYLDCHVVETGDEDTIQRALDDVAKLDEIGA